MEGAGNVVNRFRDETLSDAPDVIATGRLRGARPVRHRARQHGAVHARPGHGREAPSRIARSRRSGYVVRGQGRMWRKAGGAGGRSAELAAGVSVSIPTGTHFQFRSDGAEKLEAVAVTMPPWPGDGEAYFVAGQVGSDGLMRCIFGGDMALLIVNLDRQIGNAQLWRDTFAAQLPDLEIRIWPDAGNLADIEYLAFIRPDFDALPALAESEGDVQPLGRGRGVRQPSEAAARCRSASWSRRAAIR